MFGLQGAVLAERTRGICGGTAPELSIAHWIDGQGNQSSSLSITEYRGKRIYLKCFQKWRPVCHSVGLPNLKAAQPFGQDPDNTDLPSSDP